MAKHAKTLTEFFDEEALASRKIAFTTIDVQNHFTNPAFGVHGTPLTNQVAQRIINYTSLFRDAGFPIIHVYMNDEKGQPPKDSYGGFHDNFPKKTDNFAEKQHPSALYKNNSQLESIIDDLEIVGIFAVGFFTSTCVQMTVNAAVLKKSLGVCVLSDLVSDADKKGGKALSRIQRRGISVIQSNQLNLHYS